MPMTFYLHINSLPKSHSSHRLYRNQGPYGGNVSFVALASGLITRWPCGRVGQDSKLRVALWSLLRKRGCRVWLACVVPGHSDDGRLLDHGAWWAGRCCSPGSGVGWGRPGRCASLGVADDIYVTLLAAAQVSAWPPQTRPNPHTTLWNRLDSSGCARLSCDH